MDQKHTYSDSPFHRIFHNPVDMDVPANSFIDAPPDTYAELAALRQENASLRQTVRLNEGLRQRFEEFYDTAPVGYLTLGADDHIIEANLTLARQLGAEFPQLIGQHVGNFIAETSHAEFIHHLTQVRDSQQPHTCTLTMQDTHHRTFNVCLESKPVDMAFATPLVTIRSCIRSISEETINKQTPNDWEAINSQLQTEIHQREQIEEKFRQLQARMVHVARLNTQLLMAISSYTQSGIKLLRSVQEKGHDPEQHLERLVKTLTKTLIQAEHAAKIAHNLSRFVSQATPHREPTDLTKVVRNAVNRMLNELRNNHIKLNIHQEKNLPACETDPVQIEQVIVNLLRNAIEAMADVPADHRRLTIELQTIDEERMRLLVRDTGSGIDKNNIAKISTPFFSTKGKGRGIGLTISRTIIEDHGGQLTFEAHDEGGATFSFTLARNGRP